MPYLPLRKIADSPSNTVATEWLESLAHELADTSTDRSALCQRTLTSLYYPEYAGNWETAVADAKLPPATRLALAAMDPRNVSLEPEYYGFDIPDAFVVGYGLDYNDEYRHLPYVGVLPVD